MVSLFGGGGGLPELGLGFGGPPEVAWRLRGLPKLVWMRWTSSDRYGVWGIAVVGYRYCYRRVFGVEHEGGGLPELGLGFGGPPEVAWRLRGLPKLVWMRWTSSDRYGVWGIAVVGYRYCYRRVFGVEHEGEVLSHPYQ
ncbi:unnamed protein product [Ilex paraguariensis]|uniref:Uncharacterized protein n=1 Tax=Ilex paraguariensis TaxID=185542 RepID=A0ABC8V4R4_9AQUA